MLQVVGSRGPTEVNPRNLMVTESSITGVALGTATPVSLGGSSWLFLCHTLSQLLNNQCNSSFSYITLQR